MTVTSNNAQLEVPSSFVYFENRDSDTGKAVARLQQV